MLIGMDIEQQENNRLYHLSFWWFLLASVSVGILTEGIAFFEGWGVWFETWGYFLMCGIAFLLCLSYCVFAHVHFRVKPTWIFLALFLLLFAGNTTALAVFPKYSALLSPFREPPVEVAYVLGDVDRIRYILSFGITCFYFYLFWAIAPKCLRNSRVVLVVIVGLLLLCFALLIYSWIVEWDKYVCFFDPKVDLFYESRIGSFAGNRNIFGAILMFGIVSLGILQSRRHCWVNYILMSLFALEEVFVFSKTCLIILAIYFPAFILYRFLTTVRFNPVRSCVCLSIFLHVCIAIAIAWILSVNALEGSFFEKIGKMLMGTIFTKEHQSMDARRRIWGFLLDQLNSPVRIAFGLGEGNMQWFLGFCDGSGEFSFTHNGFLLQLAAGGVLRSAIYVLLFAYVCFLYIRAFVRHRRGTWPFVLGFLALHMHALTETTSFLETDGKGIILCFILILPFLIEQRKASAAEHDPVFAEKGRRCLTKPLTYTLLGLTLLPLASAILLYVERLHGWNPIFSFVLFGLTAFLIPLFLLIASCVQKKCFLREYLLICGLLALLLSGCFLLAYFLPLAQAASNIALLSILSLLCYALAFASCRNWLDFSAVGEAQRRIEEYVATRSPRWFAKGQRREDRYFSKH